MHQLYFGKCNCDLGCIDQVLTNSGYDFHRIQENVWHYTTQDFSLEIAGNYSSDNYLKFDPSYERDSSNASKIHKELFSIAKLLRDICEPDKIENYIKLKLDYDTFERSK